MYTKALSYISSQQQTDGSFLSLSSPDHINFSDSISFKTIFSNALILSCLCCLEQTSGVKKMSEKLSAFLLSEKGENGSWNYWSRGCGEYKTLPYPDDLDDTFCVLSALFLYDKKLIDGRVMADCVGLLTGCEVDEGGPYKTWLVSADAPKVWQDIDPVVNANIAYFLSLQDISLPNLEKLFQMTVNEKKFTSPYYPTPYPYIYFLSRFIKGKTKLSLRKFLSELSPITSLDIALTISALLNMGVPTIKVKKLIELLIDQQSADGSWKAAAFYTGVNPHKDRLFYGGSEVLTTAFCLEALHKYELANTTIKSGSTTREVFIYTQISDQLREKFEELPNPLSQVALAQLVKIQKRERVIFLLPFLFGQEFKNDLSDQFFIELGKANVLGWIAYTIYDDFLDQEGDIQLLSCANFCLRQLTAIFSFLLPEGTIFQKLFEDTMNQLDASNSWEIQYCRLPITDGCINLHKLPEIELSRISQKSAGHTLGPLAIICATGKTNQLEIFQQFFHHYLLAKQLNDDAHDVFDDLKKGFATPVVIQLLNDFAQSNPQASHLSVKSGKLTNLFWTKTIVTACQQILDSCDQAKKLAKEKAFLLKLIAPLERSAQQALTEHQQAQQFLKKYDINKV